MPDSSTHTVTLDIASPDLSSFIGQTLSLAGFAVQKDGASGSIHITDVQGYKRKPSADTVIVVGDPAALEPVQDAILLPYPLRAGFLLDTVRKCILQQVSAYPGEVHIGPYVFFPAAMALHRDGQDVPIKLTEKERDLLFFLYSREGQTVSRHEILQTLWGYADGVETHTLETHFYRLRQKIEADPSRPQLLVTSDDGYCLKI